MDLQRCEDSHYWKWFALRLPGIPQSLRAHNTETHIIAPIIGIGVVPIGRTSKFGRKVPASFPYISIYPKTCLYRHLIGLQFKVYKNRIYIPNIHLRVPL